jgi:quaternary ammonium compound-resistance protein SugE
MNAWIYLIVAGILEMGFTTSMKLSQGMTKIPYIVSFCLFAMLSLFCLNKAMVGIPLGTAYAVWTGIGAFGTALIGIVYFNEPTDMLRILMLITLIGSVIGLKFAA